MRTVVLVHGAWHGPWCWAPVLARLDELGVPTVAVDLPGPDLRSDADHVGAVLDAVAGAVLVGHDYGGAVVTDAGTHPAVERLVYVAAYAPDQGESVLARAASSTERSQLDDAIRISDDATTTSIDPELAPGALYGDCDPADAERAVLLLRPQPLTSFVQGPRAAAWEERPTTYIVCGDDRALPPSSQRAMAERIPGCALIELPTSSHSPFFSRPGEVTDALAGLAVPE